MSETTTGTAAKAHDAAKVEEKRRHPEPAQGGLGAGDMLLLDTLLGGSVADPRLDRHAALLSDPRLSHTANAGLKQQMVSGLQAKYGNVYVQRLLDSRAVQAKLTVNPPDRRGEREDDCVVDTVMRTVGLPNLRVLTFKVLQRETSQETEDWQRSMIPQELLTSIDVSSLSDEELRRRSELILVTLGQFRAKTPTTQSLEDDVVRIAEVVAKRPTDVGKRIVENYEASARKTPGGLCYAAALKRVKQAYVDILGQDLTESMPKGETRRAFDVLWGSHIKPKRDWLRLPEEYRGKGSAGAMAYAGKGTIVEQGQIWSGDLLPGATVQTWVFSSDFDRVKEGKKPQVGSAHYGHSFIFLRYKRKGDKPDAEIEGMEIADQGYQSQGVVGKAAYGYWVAASVSGNLPYGRGKGDENLIRSLLSGRNKIRGGESEATNFNLLGGKRFKLDACRVVSEIKKGAAEITDEDIKKAVNSLNPDRFNVYFTQLVALYQLGLGMRVDGRFGDGTSKGLVGKPRKSARSLQATSVMPSSQSVQRQVENGAEAQVGKHTNTPSESGVNVSGSLSATTVALPPNASVLNGSAQPGGNGRGQTKPLAQLDRKLEKKEEQVQAKAASTNALPSLGDESRTIQRVEAKVQNASGGKPAAKEPGDVGTDLSRETLNGQVVSGLQTSYGNAYVQRVVNQMRGREYTEYARRTPGHTDIQRSPDTEGGDKKPAESNLLRMRSEGPIADKTSPIGELRLKLKSEALFMPSPELCEELARKSALTWIILQKFPEPEESVMSQFITALKGKVKDSASKGQSDLTDPTLIYEFAQLEAFLAVFKQGAKLGKKEDLSAKEMKEAKDKLTEALGKALESTRFFAKWKNNIEAKAKEYWPELLAAGVAVGGIMVAQAAQSGQWENVSALADKLPGLVDQTIDIGDNWKLKLSLKESKPFGEEGKGTVIGLSPAVGLQYTYGDGKTIELAGTANLRFATEKGAPFGMRYGAFLGLTGTF